MTTYDLIVNVNPAIVDLVTEAKYELCLGAFTQAGGTAFSSAAISRIPMSVYPGFNVANLLLEHSPLTNYACFSDQGQPISSGVVGPRVS